MLYSYEDYLAKFYETLRRQGFPPSANAFHDLMHGIPQPLSREQFFECYIEAMEPFVQDGFIYSHTMKPFARAGFNYFGLVAEDARALKPAGEIKKVSATASSKPPLPC